MFRVCSARLMSFGSEVNRSKFIFVPCGNGVEKEMKASLLLLLLLLVAVVSGEKVAELQFSTASLSFRGATVNVGTSGKVFVVSGATGRTGSQTYHGLAHEDVAVRALVRNVTKARQVFGCGECGEEQGVFVGDVTDKASLHAAMDGAYGLIILTSSIPLKKDGHYVYPKNGTPKDVDWKGAVNQIEVALEKGVKQIVLVSSMGTTTPDSFLDKLGNGHALFYKLNSEAYLMQSGVSSYTIFKPCGLTDSKLAKAGSQVGVCDGFPHPPVVPLIARSKVADFIVASVVHSAEASNLRVDICNDPLRPLMQDDYVKLFASARKSTCNL